RASLGVAHESLADLGSRRDIESPCRVVGNDQRRLVAELTPEDDALQVAARQKPHRSGDREGHTECRRHLPCSFVDTARREPRPEGTTTLPPEQRILPYAHGCGETGSEMPGGNEREAPSRLSARP